MQIFFYLPIFFFSRLDLKKGRLDIGLFIPLIKVEAKYDLKGNILLLPLVGIGDAKLYLSELKNFVKSGKKNFIKIYRPNIRAPERN